MSKLCGRTHNAINCSSEGLKLWNEILQTRVRVSVFQARKVFLTCPKIFTYHKTDTVASRNGIGFSYPYIRQTYSARVAWNLGLSPEDIIKENLIPLAEPNPAFRQ